MLTFPRAFSRELRPLIRLLEDPFFNESGTPSSLFRSSSPSVNAFSPSFDVKETKDSYVLDGELPGITDKSNLDLQFVDPHTLVIKGRIERSSSNSNEEADGVNINSSATPAGTPVEKSRARSPTVEDDPEDASSTVNTQTAVEKSAPTTVTQPTDHNGHKYWVQERMVGEFQRSFSFPANIDQDAVKASLKNGILSIVVPKRKVSGAAKRIQIE